MGSQQIRNSLGIKLILSNKNTINILDSNSFETQLLVSILDILISSNTNNFIYQNDKDSSIRKEAYSKGYFLKTLKSNFSKWKKLMPTNNQLKKKKKKKKKK